MFRTAWLLSALLLLPNVLWLAFLPPPGAQALKPIAAAWVKPLQPVELILRLAVFVLPCFLLFDWRGPSVPAWAGVTALALLVYYGAWIRYFAGGRSPALLFRSWLGIPVPLAVAPVVCLLGAAALTRSMLLFGVVVLFGVIHILISALQARML
jgi:hypothetical protein